MRDGSVTRKKIERCALTLFVKKGVAATTIKDIASKAQIAEGAMYRHFKSKEELAQYLFSHSYQELTQALKEQTEHLSHYQDKIKTMVSFFCTQYDQDPILFNYLLLVMHTQIKGASDKEVNAFTYLVSVFNEALKKKELTGVNPQICADIVLGIVLQAATSRVYGRVTRPLSEDIDTLVKAIIGGVKAL